MQDKRYGTLLDEQRNFFSTGTTLSIHFRIEQLKKLKAIIQNNESAIVAALRKDLHKSEMESVVTEIIIVTDEIDHIIKNLKKWSKPTKVPSPFPLCWPGKSEIHHEPYGSVLIIGPWNFPFMLIMSPLIGAICAGNCAIVKPSEIASHTQDMIVGLINNHFPSEYITAIKGGPQEVTRLLDEKFDYVFFTGGTQIGKIILEAAARHLTPVTLELGGKSPCIVDETANLDFAARRIVWGKLMNAGQVCLAPDYLYVHHSCKTALVEKLIAAVKKFYGDDPSKSSSYCKIINKRHFDRLTRLLKNGNILYGGSTSEPDLYIAPTLIDNVSWTDPVMQEEIFGPILPILTYDNLEDVIKTVNSHPKPLSLYLFTKNKHHEKNVLKHVSFGGGCINDCLLQIANYHLPFGGVGSSGLGAYHGKYSFETFSHRKSIFRKSPPIDLALEYPPYTRKKLVWLKRLLKLG
jgi:aldehyde dehydrogenase (NAD+)